MRYDIIFYVLAGLNIIGSFIGNNSMSSALGWGVAILYAWGYYNKDAKCVEGEK